MSGFSGELIEVVYRLLPGFLSAWIFYSLTAYQRPNTFERVVQALIFTVIVQACTILVRELVFALSEWFTAGSWTDDSSLLCSIVLAVVVGLIFSWSANNDFPQKFLRTDHDWPEWLGPIGWLFSKLRLTHNTAMPSEWFSGFSRNKRRWVVLHLTGQRRILGFPSEWPNQPDRGHFILMWPRWLLDDGRAVRSHEVESTMIPADAVKMVEFVKHPHEIEASDEERAEVMESVSRTQMAEAGDAD